MSNYTIDIASYVATLPADEREAAQATHQYDWEELRCWNCDCRPSGSWSQLPCGTGPGRGLPDHVAPWTGPLDAFG